MATKMLNQTQLREQVRQLAEQAFHQHLISGHGDGEYEDEYQIFLEGKPRHYRLIRAFYLLQSLLQDSNKN
jgi:hypothetical protein